MATDTHASSPSQFGTLAESALKDLEKMLEQHFALLGGEMKEGLTEVKQAVASIGTGAGAAALGGALGAFGVVHLLHRVTPLPLWACYGLVGGLLGVGGSALLAGGLKQAVGVDLIPHQTAQSLRETFAGAK